MPVPQDLRVYGRHDILRAVGHPQPPVANPPFNQNRRLQPVRGITYHYTHGWIYSAGWRQDGQFWYGTQFNIDLDGVLYQCVESDVMTAHVGGAPWFTGAYGFVNQTFIGCECVRFGLFRRQGNRYRISGYDIFFEELPAGEDPEWCDYHTHPTPHGGPAKFNLWKIPGGKTYRNTARRYYLVRAATFDDVRNPERSNLPMDILFSEEQYRTMVLWGKAMCEMHRIPKDFLTDPSSGRPNPWIDVEPLVGSTLPAAVRNERRERVRSHQGIIGHFNVDADRSDPGPSMDWYRIRRGMSDAWWYPMNLDATPRAVDYLDVGNSARYLQMEFHGETSAEVQGAHFRANEGAELGFFPLGANRIWHGGIHLPTPEGPRPVYAMANGQIVAARVVNHEAGPARYPYSRCFVLVKHSVHTRDVGLEIDYGLNTTDVVYSLYMHLDSIVPPARFEHEGIQRWVRDYEHLPVWLNHYLIDHPDDDRVFRGEVFVPDVPVTLGDWIGKTGKYIVSRSSASSRRRPRFGHTLHIEVFTDVNPSRFRGSPWENARNRVEDPTLNDVVSDLGLLDAWIKDQAGDGLDSVDVKNAAPRLRDVAVRHRSEWSIERPEELTRELFRIQNKPTSIGEVMTQAEFDRDVRPLSFHGEMVAAPRASQDVIGPFFQTKTLWYLHPFVFLAWMNGRVERHERIMREQDKPRANHPSNIRVEQGFVVGWKNLRGGANDQELVRNVAGVRYPELSYSENTFEVNVDAVADQAALRGAAQTRTHFHLHLLEALDILNDRAHGARVVEGFVRGAVECSGIGRQDVHRQGLCMDIRPSRPDQIGEWFTLYRSAMTAATYFRRVNGDEFEIAISSDPGVNAADERDLAAAAADLERRLAAAADAGDAVLTQLPAQAHLTRLRLHFGFTAADTASASIRDVAFVDALGRPLHGPIIPGDEVAVAVKTHQIRPGEPIFVVILSRPPAGTQDITKEDDLRRLYGSLTFDVARMEQHGTLPGVAGAFVARVQKPVSDVDPKGDATFHAYFQVPKLQDTWASLYAVAIAPAGTKVLALASPTNHLSRVSTDVLTLPTINRVWIAATASGSLHTPVLVRGPVHVIVETSGMPAGASVTVDMKPWYRNVARRETVLASGGRTSLLFDLATIGNYNAFVRVEVDGVEIRSAYSEQFAVII